MKITEEWLKANGWETHRYDIEFRVEIFHFAIKMFGENMVQWNDKHKLTIFRDYKNGDVYADVLIDNVDSVEKLQEALVFCEVITAKTNPLFEKCLANVNPETRAEVRKNMDAALTWHKVSKELPPIDTEVVCKMKGVPYTEHFICKWDGEHWWHWGWLRQDAQGWFGLNEGWKIVEWKEI